MAIIPHLRSVNSYNILYRDGGDPNNKSVIVLLHGIGASSDRWIKVIPILSKDFYVLAPDIIGFGYSEKPEVNYTIDFFTDFVFDFIKSMNVQDRELTLIGSSLGGHIAAEFAIKYDILKRLVLVTPAGIHKYATSALNDYILAAMYPTLENAFNAFANMVNNPNTIDMEYVKDFVNRMRMPNAKYAFLAALMGSKRAVNLKYRVDKIKTKTLVIWGSNDKLLPINDEVKEVLSMMSNAKIIIMNDTAHLPFVEKPNEFCDIVTKFIRCVL